MTKEEFDVETFLESLDKDGIFDFLSVFLDGMILAHDKGYSSEDILAVINDDDLYTDNKDLKVKEITKFIFIPFFNEKITKYFL